MPKIKIVFANFLNKKLKKLIIKYKTKTINTITKMKLIKAGYQILLFNREDNFLNKKGVLITVKTNKTHI